MERGTALDMSAENLSGYDDMFPSARDASFIVTSSPLCSKLIKEGGEFSRALHGAGGWGAPRRSAGFEKELAILQHFPEQLGSK